MEPLYVHVEWEDGAVPGPFSPVKKVILGYREKTGLKEMVAEDGPDGSDKGMWATVAGVLAGYAESVPDGVVAGFGLRSLQWPAVVAGLVKSGARKGIGRGNRFLMPTCDKWASKSVIDLRNLVLQGGWWEEADLDGAYRVWTGKDPAGLSPVAKMDEMFHAYDDLAPQPEKRPWRG